MYHEYLPDYSICPHITDLQRSPLKVRPSPATDVAPYQGQSIREYPDDVIAQYDVPTYCGTVLYCTFIPI